MNRTLLTPRVLLASLILALLLFAAILALLWFTRPEAQPATPVAAVLNVTSAPTPTPVPTIPVLPPTPTTAPSSPEDLVAGGYAQVSGTGGDGLRLRASPGLNGEILLLGNEGEIYFVQEGPQDIDGYTWWLLVDPDDETRRGWAVADFLKPSQNP
jgi:hypothetical protein